MANPSQGAARWLAEARVALEESIGGPPAGAVTVIVRDQGGNRVSFTIVGAEAGERPAVALSPLERRIVAAIERGPLIGKRLAVAIGQRYDGGLRTILANLCERDPPVIESTRAGYRLVTPAHSPEPR